MQITNTALRESKQIPGSIKKRGNNFSNNYTCIKNHVIATLVPTVTKNVQKRQQSDVK